MNREREWSNQEISNWVSKLEVMPETISVDDARVKHKNQWILMRITAFDFDKWPSHGYVIANSENENKVNEVLSDELVLEQPPLLTYYSFYSNGRPLLRTGGIGRAIDMTEQEAHAFALQMGKVRKEMYEILAEENSNGNK